MRGAGYTSGPSAMQNRTPNMPKLLSQNINTAERGRGRKMYPGQTSPRPLRTGHSCTNGPSGPRSLLASAPRQPAVMPPLTRFKMADMTKLLDTLPTAPVAQKSSQITGTGDLAHKTKDADNGNVTKKIQTPPKISLSTSAVDARPVLPGSRESVIYLALFGEVITCDLKTLGSDPAAIIELLKVTQGETGSYVIVAAHYRRSSLPHSAKLVMEAMLEGK